MCCINSLCTGCWLLFHFCLVKLKTLVLCWVYFCFKSELFLSALVFVHRHFVQTQLKIERNLVLLNQNQKKNNQQSWKSTGMLVWFTTMLITDNILTNWWREYKQRETWKNIYLKKNNETKNGTFKLRSVIQSFLI